MSDFYSFYFLNVLQYSLITEINPFSLIFKHKNYNVEIL